MQITAHCSTAHVTCQHLQRSHGERPQLFTKFWLWQRRTVDTISFLFLLLSCCHSPVCSHYISWWPLGDCIIKLTGSITVLLQPWLTLYMCLHWLILWYPIKLKCPCHVLFAFAMQIALSKQGLIKFFGLGPIKKVLGRKEANVSAVFYNSHTVMLSAHHCNPVKVF